MQISDLNSGTSALVPIQKQQSILKINVKNLEPDDLRTFNKNIKRPIHLILSAYTNITELFIEALAQLSMLHILDLGYTNITNEYIKDLAPSFPQSLSSGQSLIHLHTLNIENTQISDDGAFFLADFPALTHLSVRNTQITDIGIVYFSSLNKLKVLNLESTKITDQIMPLLTFSFKQLRTLNLNKTQITNCSLPYIGKLSRLTSLFLFDVQQVTNKPVLHLERALPKLRIFRPICHIEKIPNALRRKIADFLEIRGLFRLKQTSKSLYLVEPLEIHQAFTTFQLFNQFMKKRNPKVISLGIYSVKKDSLKKEIIEKIAPTLRRLFIYSINDIINKRIPFLASFTCLTQLNLGGIIPNEMLMQSLCHLKKLKILRLNYIALETPNASMTPFPSLLNLEVLELIFSSWSNSEANIKNMQSVGNLHNLTELHIGQTELKDKDLSFLSSLRKLCTLNMNSNQQMSGFFPVEKFTSLIALNLNFTKLTDEGLDFLTSTPRFQTQLQELTIMGNAITDEGMLYVSRLSKLIQFSASQTKVTDIGLLHLKNLCQLEELDMGRNKGITDTGIMHLASSIIKLNLYSTGITDKGLDHITRSLPHLKKLNIGENEITDKGILFLTRLKRLISLDLNRLVNITNQSVSWFSTIPTLRNLSMMNCPNITEEGFSEITAKALIWHSQDII